MDAGPIAPLPAVPDQLSRRPGLFAQVLLGFALTLLVFSILLSGVLLLGVQRSLETWARERQAEYLRLATALLTGSIGSGELQAPGGDPLFVYDSSGELLYTNRGLGRRQQAGGAESLVPVRVGDAVLGYYFAPRRRFEDDAASQRFLESAFRALWVGFAAALGISLGAAALLSRRLSRPVREVARSLDAMTRGDFSRRIRSAGVRELAVLAAGANRLGAQLAQEREIRRQWAQDVAHDLRTPIAVMKAQFEAMHDGVLEVSPSRIQKSIREIERMERLVLDLTELTRLESPEMRLRPERTELGPLLAAVRDQFAFEIGRRGIGLEVDGSGVVAADAALLARALVNCLSNAVRHTPESGSIRLAACVAGARALIEVSNTGDVLSEDERQRIFDRLYRGEAARESPGSGLGLTIARRIAELHGGTIRATDYGGRGTSIEISLPGASSAI